MGRGEFTVAGLTCGDRATEETSRHAQHRTCPLASCNGRRTTLRRGAQALAVVRTTVRGSTAAALEQLRSQRLQPNRVVAYLPKKG